MMSFQAKRELLTQVAGRYSEASGRQKSLILDEFVAATGYQRKYAIRLLRRPPPVSPAMKRPRVRRYGLPVQDALKITWAAANFICAKRLVPFLPELVPVLERHGHLRTMQRRVREWRAQCILVFDDQWLQEERVIKMELPHPLQAELER